MASVTKASDERKWRLLMKQWEDEHYPGMLVTSGKSYKVLRLLGDAVEFEEVNAEGYYESRSFDNVGK